MKIFPDSQTFISFGAVSIKWYAVLILTGAFFAYLISVNEIKKRRNISVDWFSDLFIYTLWFGIIGARIWFCVFYNFDYFIKNPASIIRVWDGGLAIQGGIVAGLIFVYLECKKHKVDFYVLLDCLLPNVLIGQAFGRWGNYVNKECHGGQVDASYFDGILSFLKEGMHINGAYYEPLFFYESCLCLLGWIFIYFLLRPRQNKRGDLAYAYMMWYGVIRFFIERTRTDSLMLGNIKMAQLTSVIFLLIGLLGYLGIIDKLFKKKKPSVIFDMDGTLINTTPAILKSYEALFEKYDDINNFTQERRAEVLGPALKDIFPKYFPNYGYDELYAVYHEAQDKVSDLNYPFENVPEVLKTLHDDGYKIAIISTRTHEGIVRLLEYFNLSEYVDEICGLRDVEKLKPDPEGIIKIVANKGFNATDVILVGDSVMDIKCGQNYGAYTIGYVTHEDKRQQMLDAKANRYIENMADLLDIVKEDHYFTYNEK